MAKKTASTPAKRTGTTVKKKSTASKRAGSTAKKPAAKKTTAKKTTAKRPAAKKTTAKKPAARRTVKKPVVLEKRKIESPDLEKTEEEIEKGQVSLQDILRGNSGDQEPEDQEPEDQEPEDQEPEDQEPEDREPEGQEPEGQEPEDQEPEDQEPEGQEPEDQESLEEVQSEVPIESLLRDKTEGEKRTIYFKRVLQQNITEILGSRLGKRISDDVAYKVFKECIDSMVEFVRTDDENRLPLAGIGTFMIQMNSPRKSANSKNDSVLMKYDKIPHLKWKPSLRYTNYLFEKILGEVYIDYSTRKKYPKK